MSPNKKSTTTKTPVVPHTEASTAEAKQNRQYLMIMIGISLVLVIAGGYVIDKLFNSYIKRTNEVKAQDQYISDLKQKKTNLATLQQNYQAITQPQSNGLSIADEIFRAVPKHPDYKTLIGIIENISTLSGTKASISPGNITTAGDTSSSSTSASSSTSGGSASTGATDADFTGNKPVPYQFNVTVSGQYAQVINFLQLTETSLRPINFQSMTLSGTSGTIQANLTFQTYYQGLADIANKQEPLK